MLRDAAVLVLVIVLVQVSLHDSKYLLMRFIHSFSSSARGIHSLKRRSWLSGRAFKVNADVARAKLLLHESCWQPDFFDRDIHAPRIFFWQFFIVGSGYFSNVGGCSFVYVWFNLWYITKPEISALWWKLSSAFLFLVERFHDSHPQRTVLITKALYIAYLVLISTSLLLKKCLVCPIVAFALFMRTFISASSLSSVVMHEPRYLKQWVNCTCWLLGRVRSGGRMLFLVRFFAVFKEAGINIASVLDLMLSFPTCISIPSHLKCWMRVGVKDSSSSRLSVTKTLSSTKNTLLKLKGVPLELVGCPISLPFSAFRLPFLGGLKNLNSVGLVSSGTVSRNACMMYAKRTGEALSPC